MTEDTSAKAGIIRQRDTSPATDDPVPRSSASTSVRIRPIQQAIERARDLVRRHVADGTSLAEELINERHEAARSE